MSKHIKHASKKLGKSPGSLEFIGKRKTESVEITLVDYTEKNLESRSLENIEASYPFLDQLSVTWINIYGLHDTALLDKLGQKLDIHPLVMEDVLNTGQRPKIELYDDYIFIVLKMIYFNEEYHALNVEQISLICKNNLVLCFQERHGDVFKSIRQRMKNPQSRLRKNGADYLTYALIDVIVDHYFVILENIGDVIERLDEIILDEPKIELVQEINQLKRMLISLRKSVFPLREVISVISREEVTFFTKHTVPFIRDLYDHTIQVIDALESYRDMASGLMDMYMTNVSNRMNEVMKVLTIIATIFIPLSFLAGVYGMNFDTAVSPYNLPELESRYGYPIFWGLVVLITGGLLAFFRKRKWI